MDVLRLSQTVETPVAHLGTASFRCSYAYARSAETRASGDGGQDYLVLQHDGQSRLAFALCDGVGQSFFGELAAVALGDALVEWLWALPAALGADRFSELLGLQLRQVVPIVHERVQRYRIPDQVPMIVRQVLEQKRVLGSATTFVCARLDEEALLAAWMGDSRLRVWGPSGEMELNPLGVQSESGGQFDNVHTGSRHVVNLNPLGVQSESGGQFDNVHTGPRHVVALAGAFRSGDQWSSARGLVGGGPTVFVSPRAGVRRVVAYSDGLAALDGASELPDPGGLQALIDASGGDDISYVDVAPLEKVVLAPAPAPEPAPEPLPEPAPVPAPAPQRPIVLGSPAAAGGRRPLIPPADLPPPRPWTPPVVAPVREDAAPARLASEPEPLTTPPEPEAAPEPAPEEPPRRRRRFRAAPSDE